LILYSKKNQKQKKNHDKTTHMSPLCPGSVHHHAIQYRNIGGFWGEYEFVG